MTIEIGDKVICVWDGEEWEAIEGYVPDVGETVLAKGIQGNPKYAVMGLGSFEVGDIITIWPGGLMGGLGFEFPPFAMPTYPGQYEPFYDSQYWSDSDFQSAATQYFNGGLSLPAGYYKLTVTGWFSLWDEYANPPICPDGYVAGALRPYITCCWDRLNLVTSSGDTPVNTICTTRDLGAYEGHGTVYIPAGAVGIRMIDDPYTDNHGSTTFELERVG